LGSKYQNHNSNVLQGIADAWSRLIAVDVGGLWKAIQRWNGLSNFVAPTSKQ